MAFLVKMKHHRAHLLIEAEAVEGRSRFGDGNCNSTKIVDMSTYEFGWIYLGDFASSCDVDVEDFAILAGYWLTDEF